MSDLEVTTESWFARPQRQRRPVGHRKWLMGAAFAAGLVAGSAYTLSLPKRPLQRPMVSSGVLRFEPIFVTAPREPKAIVTADVAH